jgi:hypothetical protein
LTGPKKISGQ